MTSTSSTWSRTAAHPRPGSRVHRERPMRVIPETPRAPAPTPTTLVPGVMVRR